MQHERETGISQRLKMRYIPNPASALRSKREIGTLLGFDLYGVLFHCIVACSYFRKSKVDKTPPTQCNSRKMGGERLFALSATLLSRPACIGRHWVRERCVGKLVRGVGSRCGARSRGVTRGRRRGRHGSGGVARSLV